MTRQMYYSVERVLGVVGVEPDAAMVKGHIPTRAGAAGAELQCGRGT